MIDGAIDLQVNGYAGVDFNADAVSTEAFHVACERLRQDQVAGILATVITDSIPAMCRRLANIARARDDDELVADTILGVHIEGPFLSEEAGYIGAHPPQHAKPANLEDMKRLLDAAQGLTRIVTLAPERDRDFAITQELTSHNIIVSAGHCNPTLETLGHAVDAGLSMVTHLGNGCPLLLHRHDNFIQRVLSLSDRLLIGFIADGVHVPFHALKNYLTCAGVEHSFVVSDAIMAAGQGPGTYELGERTVVVDEQLATWVADKSHLVGSAVTMPRAITNLRSLGLAENDIDRLVRRNALQALKLV